VDPTAAVAPERIEHSIADGPQLLGDAVRFDIPRAAWLAAMWHEARYGLDALNNKWNQWVLSYGPQRQAELLSWLGRGGVAWQSVAALLLAGLGGMLTWTIVQLLKRQRRPRDPAVLAYQRFCRKLARRGLSRPEYEGPGAFAARIAAQRPDLAGQVQTIVKLYIALRYGAHRSPRTLGLLRRAVRRFHP
jgi:hypothetical protein